MKFFYSERYKSRKLSELLILVPVLLSILLYWYITAQGVGLSPDSVTYIGVADSLMQGKGLVVPFGFPPFTRLTQFPPLYSLLIAFVSLTGLSSVLSAKILNFFILLFFYFVAIKLLKLMSQKHLLISVLILTLIAVSATFLTITSMVWSELLMISLGLFGFSLVYEKKENNFLNSIFMGLIFAFAILTRYAAVTFLWAAILYILFVSRNNLKQKFVQSLIITSPGAFLLSTWLLINSSTTGTATNRSINFHLPTLSNLNELITTISGWFLVPDSASTILKLTIFLAVTLVFLVFFIVELMHILKNSTYSLTFLIMIFIFVYTFFIFFSITFLDANIPLDFRIMSPLFISAILLTLPFVQRFFTSTNRTIFYRVIPVGILSFMAIGSVTGNLETIRFIHHNGTGFKQLYRDDSQFFTYLNQQPETTIFVSNAPEPTYYFTNHPVYSLPKNYLQMAQTINSDYEKELETLKTALSNQDGLFIIYKDIQGSNKNEVDYLCQFFGLEHVKSFSEAAVYQTNHQKSALSCKN